MSDSPHQASPGGVWSVTRYGVGWPLITEVSSEPCVYDGYCLAAGGVMVELLYIIHPFLRQSKCPANVNDSLRSQSLLHGQ